MSGAPEKIQNLGYEEHPKRRHLLHKCKPTTNSFRFQVTDPTPACGELGEVPDLSHGVKNRYTREEASSLVHHKETSDFPLLIPLINWSNC